MKLTIQILLSLVAISFSGLFAEEAIVTKSLQPNSLTPVTQEAYDIHNSKVNDQRSIVNDHMKAVEGKRQERDTHLAELKDKAAAMKANSGDHAKAEQLNNECARLHRELVQHVDRLHSLMSSYSNPAA